MNFMKKGWEDLSQKLLQYGFILTDDSFSEYYFDEFGEVDGVTNTRIRFIRYGDSFYYHKMVDGRISEIKEIQNGVHKDLG